MVMDNRQKFVQVQGKEYCKEGRRLFFNGIGIGSWLNMEHFMLGIPGTDVQIRKTFADVLGTQNAEKFFDRFVYNFITEEDFRFLKENRINLVRVPFNYRLFLDDQNADTLKEKGFEYLDYLMDLARRYEIYVLLDLHTTPGGQNPDWHSDNGNGYTEFWEYDVFRRQIISLWGKIAAHYRNEEYLLGYDVLNEPFLIPQLLEGNDDAADIATGIAVQNAAAILNDFYKKVIAAIRANDPVHIIFLEGDHFASCFDCMQGIAEEQLALEFHFYPTVWYPDLYDDNYDPAMRKEKFAQVMQQLITSAEQFGRPILCGEAGYEIATNGFEKTFPLIRDTLDLFDQYDISFTLWSYKDARFMGMVIPGEDSPWMQLQKQIALLWNHHMEADRAEKTVEYLCNSGFSQATKADRYVLEFRQRALLYTLEEKYILKPLLQTYDVEQIMKLPDSFLFSNCEQYDSFSQLFDELGKKKGLIK